MTDLTGKRVLIVGASSGVGRATAIAASRAGARVAVAARRPEPLEQTRLECGANAVAWPCDVESEQACRDLVAGVSGLLGGLDGIVYAAGVARLALVVDTPASEWQRIFATNVTGFGIVFSAAHEALVRTGGQVLVLSSVSAARPKQGLVPYAASKRALEAVVEGLRTEHPDISFTLVSIGPTYPTEFGRDFDRNVSAALKPRWAESGLLAPGEMAIDDVAARVVECLSAPMRTEHLVLLPHPDSRVTSDTGTPTT